VAVVSFNVKGFAELEKKLHNLVLKTQKTIVRSALRKEAVKARDRVADNILTSGLVDSGVMYTAYKQTKIKSANVKGMIRLGPENPTREALGIDAKDKYYYPYAVEFGHIRAPAYPFIRPAIDDHKEQSINSIASDIGAGITKEALKP